MYGCDFPMWLWPIRARGMDGGWWMEAVGEWRQFGSTNKEARYIPRPLLEGKRRAYGENTSKMPTLAFSQSCLLPSYRLKQLSFTVSNKILTYFNWSQQTSAYSLFNKYLPSTLYWHYSEVLGMWQSARQTGLPALLGLPCPCHYHGSGMLTTENKYPPSCTLDHGSYSSKGQNSEQTRHPCSVGAYSPSDRVIYTSQLMLTASCGTWVKVWRNENYALLILSDPLWDLVLKTFDYLFSA